MTPTELGTVGVFLSAGAATVGFVAFACLARFWRSRGGWHVFWYMLMVAVSLDMAVTRHLFGDASWFAWLRAATFAIGMPFVLAWRSWIIFDLQLLARYRDQVAYRDADSRPADLEETHGA
jgi:FtsH-binding integral membrane protein